MKVCITCKLSKNVSEFYASQGYIRRSCKICTRVRQLASRFGTTEEKIKELYERQKGVCAICKEPCSVYDNLSVDHDHRCCPQNARSCGGCIRGLLCSHCNKALGGFKDNKTLLLNAVEYLESFAL